MVKRGLQVLAPLRLRAPSILTSSAVRSPEPWNQQTSRSPLGVSTMHEAWLCQCSKGKMSSDSRKGVSCLVEFRLAAQQTWAVRQESKNKDRPTFIGSFGRCWVHPKAAGSSGTERRGTSSHRGQLVSNGAELLKAITPRQRIRL